MKILVSTMPYSPKSAHQTGDMKRLWRNTFLYCSILISVKTPESLANYNKLNYF